MDVRNFSGYSVVTLLFGLAMLSSTFYLARSQGLKPACNQSYIPIQVVEGSTANNPVVNLNDFCSDPMNGSLNYEIYPDDGTWNTKFNFSSGILKWVKDADAEELKNVSTQEYAFPWALSVKVSNKNGSVFLTVLIIVNSINDNTPQIKNLANTVSLMEDTAVGKVVATCDLEDRDLPGSGQEIPSVAITGGSGNKTFTIDSKTCEIRLLAPLDYDVAKTYDLVLTVKDSDPTSPLINTATINIIVTNVNKAPTCSYYIAIKKVNEDTPVGDSLFRLNCSSTYPGPLQFSIGNSTEVNINSTTGEISLIRQLDFEKNDRNFEISVFVSNNGTSITTVTVSIVVGDVDDNNPVFTSSNYTTTILESTPVGNVVVSLSATDEDEKNTPRSRITYGLEGCSQNWFLVDANSGMFLVSRQMSKATAPVVSCRVYAISSSANKTFANVTITIITGKPPVFTQDFVTQKVTENIPMGNVVLNVTAVGDGVIKYSLPFGSPFEIDSKTGAITVKSVVDYEAEKNHLVPVVASDSSTPSLSSTTTVLIPVDPQNEFNPSMDFTTLGNVTVREDAEPGSLVITITATDGDAGLDGKIRYKLNNPNVPFILEAESGSLKVGPGIDFEKNNFYSLDIFASDLSETSPKNSTKTLNVYVINTNDDDPACEPLGPIFVANTIFNTDDRIGQLKCNSSNTLRYTEAGGDTYNNFIIDPGIGQIRISRFPEAGIYFYNVTVSDQGSPERIITVSVEIRVQTFLTFSNLPTIITIRENVQPLDLIYSVNAKGTYLSVVYEITSGNDAGKFYLHPSLGELRLFVLLDVETETNTYTLTIKASTSNGDAIQSPLTITVTDVNDNVPTYVNSFYHFNISETQTVGTNVNQFTATDKDISAVNKQIVYSIVSGNTGGVFEYDASSGYLKLVVKLDHDTTSSYTLVLKAANTASPYLESTTTVFIQVLDANDSKPILVPSGNNMSLTFPEDTAIGAPIIKINATHGSKSSDLTFTLEIGNTDMFFIHEKTGLISLVYPFDYEKGTSHFLMIRINSTDGQTNVTSCLITVTDVNDNSPEFSRGNYVFHVPHGTPAGATIDTLDVTDADSGINKDVILSIASGDSNNTFHFDNHTLKSLKRLDANIQNMYELIVLAKDSGTPSRNATARVTIHVDPQFKPPLFVPKTASIDKSENTRTGELIFDADATYDRAKEHADGDLFYNISSGNTYNTFYVEEYTGVIQLLKLLDYSATQFYNLTITATNRYDSSLIDYFNLIINVKQENRYAPVLTKLLYTFDVLENATSGTFVGIVSATDKDPGQYGVPHYDIEPNSYVTIDRTSGAITVSGQLEYSVVKSLNLYVTATDNAGNLSRTTSGVVIMRVIDVNNHAPIFTQNPYELSIPENLPINTGFFIVLAIDLDSGIFGTVLYSIISGDTDSVFSIDHGTGVLALSKPLDYETKKQYNLEVEGKDGAAVPLRNTANVIINVLNSNDNAPQFSPSRIELSVRSDTPPLTSLYTCSAKDADTVSSKLTYFIETDNSPNLFSLGSTTGVLKTAAVLDTESGYYLLEVVAIDEGTPVMSGTVTFGIAVQPVQSSLPGDYSFTAKENEPVGILVGTIPKDQALTINSYAITGGNFGNAFTISMNSGQEGVITSNIILDRENYPNYQLTVYVNHTSGIKVLVTLVKVEDVNDNSPKFTRSQLNLQMVENLAAGSVIGALCVTDADEGINSQITFTIPQKSFGGGYFSVLTSGEITVTGKVSYEVVKVANFEVTATDGGTPSLSAKANVTVNIIDINETIILTPIEAAYFKSVEFPDDALAEEIVGLVTPSDVNITSSTADRVQFTIVDQDSVFTIHPSTGVVTVRLQNWVFPDAKYTQWIIVTVTSGGVSTSKALMLRLDTFNKATHLITVVVNTDVADLVAQRYLLLANLQSQFSAPQQVKLWSPQLTSTSGRRRLLQTRSEGQVLVLADKSVDNMQNIDRSKTFVTSQEALKSLQTSSGDPNSALTSGTPSVTSVSKYSGSTNERDKDDDLAPEIIAVIVIGSLAALALLIAICLLIYYCIVRRRENRREDERNLMDKKTKKQKISFVAVPPDETSTKKDNFPKTRVDYGPTGESRVIGGGSAVYTGNMAANEPSLNHNRSNGTNHSNLSKNRNNAGPSTKGQPPAEKSGPSIENSGTSINPDSVLSDPGDNPDSDGAPTQPIRATYISSTRANLHKDTTRTAKPTSIMLESLEEKEENKLGEDNYYG